MEREPVLKTGVWNLDHVVLQGKAGDWRRVTESPLQPVLCLLYQASGVGVEQGSKGALNMSASIA